MQLVKEAIRTIPSNLRKKSGIPPKRLPQLIPKVRMDLIWLEETKKWKSVMGDGLPASKYLEV